MATIYNLVGQRDRVLLAVLDHTASTIRDQLKHDEATLGIDRCLAVIATACDAILADPSVHRHALAALGEVSQGQWLDEGLYETIEASIIDAIEQRELGSEVAASSTAVAVQLGFRGALMSWSFGQLNDDELIQTSQLTAALTLAATARPSHRRRLHALASQPSEINDIRQLPTKRSNQ